MKLHTKEDFEWYKKELDVIARYEHRHLGKPKKYPCKVKSVWEDDPNGPYTYKHFFKYRVEKKCPHCGQVIKSWSEDWE